MKVLIIAPYFFERHRWMISAYKTALELSKDCQVVVLTTGSPRFEELSPSLRVYRMADLFLPDPINYSIVPGLWWSLRRVIRKERPDVFLVNKHMFFTSFAILMLRMMKKKVITATDTFPGLNWFPRRRWVAAVMRLYAWGIGVPLLKLSSAVVLYHEGLIPLAQRLKLPYRVIHNGVETEQYDTALPSLAISRDGRINVGYVGRLETIKGYDDIIAVAEQITKERSNVHFSFIGNTDGKQQYVAAHESSQIHFLGHRDDLPSLYKCFDVFVLASYSEGLPNALMEAMYCGVACVSSRVGGVRTLIRDGENGLTFTAGDRVELAQAIIRLLDDPDARARMGSAARETIQRGYTWDVIRKQYAMLFAELSS